MDAFGVDLLTYVVSYCSSRKSLRLVSREFYLACAKAKVYGSTNSVNGTVCSLQSMRINGPVFMPYVTTIDLRVHTYLDGFTINECRKFIDALDLKPHSKISLKLYWPAYEACLWLQDLVKSRTWTYFSCDGPVPGPVKACILHLPANDFGPHTIATESLEIYDTHTPPFATDSSIVVSAFAAAPKKLVICGLLTDASIALLKHVNTSLKDLELHFIGCCSLVNIRRIQHVTPNLQRFVMRNSNILASDLNRLDWTLWPHLTSLDFEKNYTLLRLPNLPLRITDLNVSHTGIFLPRDLGNTGGVTRLSLSVGSNVWSDFFSARIFKTIYLDVTSIDVDVHTFNLSACPCIQVSYANKFIAGARISALRSAWPKSFIRNVD